MKFWCQPMPRVSDSFITAQKCCPVVRRMLCLTWNAWVSLPVNYRVRVQQVNSLNYLNHSFPDQFPNFVSVKYSIQFISSIPVFYFNLQLKITGLTHSVIARSVATWQSIQ